MPKKLKDGEEIQVGDKTYRVVDGELCEVRVEPVRSEPVVIYPPWSPYPYPRWERDYWYSTDDRVKLTITDGIGFCDTE